MDRRLFRPAPIDRDISLCTAPCIGWRQVGELSVNYLQVGSLQAFYCGLFRRDAGGPNIIVTPSNNSELRVRNLAEAPEARGCRAVTPRGRCSVRTNADFFGIA
jgi:hypothetical protein